MKLRQIFEASRTERIPVEITYEHEFETPDGETDMVKIVFEINVTSTPDMYATGDSPTDYQTTITNAYFKNEPSKKFNWKKEMSKKNMEWVEDQAVKKALG